MKTLLHIFLFNMLVLVGYGQTGCPNCRITLPSTLPLDTIYISALPEGRVSLAYEADLSFRLPKTTTSVAKVDSTVTPGFDIDKITVVEVNNLPEGLSWQANQREFIPATQTDGCARFCGTPSEYGLFNIEVVLESRVFVLTQRSKVIVALRIEPASSIGFSMDNNIGCGQAIVNFSNNNPSNGDERFSYLWDFGNGNTSNTENPTPQSYNAAGEYLVNYQAIVDTGIYELKTVTVLEGDCRDLIGLPDYYITIINPDGNKVFVATHFENQSLPLTFNVSLPLTSGTYTLQVNDEDSGLEGTDDRCADLKFTLFDSLVTFDGVTVMLDIPNEPDTISATDTIFVFNFPASPRIAVSSSPPVCTGDTVLLKVSNYSENLQWIRNQNAISTETTSLLKVTESGKYAVSYTSAGGCSVVSMPTEVVIHPLPPVPIFGEKTNLLRLNDSLLNLSNYNLQWYLGNQAIPNATKAEYCASIAGIYTLVLENKTTKCSNTYSDNIRITPNIFNCTISGVEPLTLANFELYPNPTQDVIHFGFYSTVAEPIELQLCDILGRVQHQEILYGRQIQQTLDMSGLPKGLYFLHLKVENKTFSQKVIKQ